MRTAQGFTNGWPKSWLWKIGDSRRCVHKNYPVLRARHCAGTLSQIFASQRPRSVRGNRDAKRASLTKFQRREERLSEGMSGYALHSPCYEVTRVYSIPSSLANTFQRESTSALVLLSMVISSGHGLAKPSLAHLRVASTPIFEP